MKIVKINQLKIVIFTAVKNHCMLHGLVFLMDQKPPSSESSFAEEALSLRGYYSAKAYINIARNRICYKIDIKDLLQIT